jgi:hypothetical protein
VVRCSADVCKADGTRRFPPKKHARAAHQWIMALRSKTSMTNQAVCLGDSARWHGSGGAGVQADVILVRTLQYIEAHLVMECFRGDAEGSVQRSHPTSIDGRQVHP